MSQTISCPSEETLAQLLDGTIDDVRKIELHLQNCNSCQSRLDKLSQSDVLQPFRKDEKYHSDSATLRFLDAPTRQDDLGTIDRFHAEAEIGRGGAGVVFRCFDPELQRHVAVKVLGSDGGFRSEARFERESKVAAKVRNDHIVSVHSIGKTSDGRPYIVMPLVSGNSLKDALAAQLPDENQVATIVGEIANGLHAIHVAGIVHRDVKPANILMDSSDGRAKLTDFGLAQDNVAGLTLTQADVLCGTPEYMSPEQSEGKEVTAQSDIYSLGITLYECLTGTTPFRGGALNILQQHCNVEPIRPKQINPTISRSIETICLKTISKEPSRRYHSAKELSDDLQRLKQGQPILARDLPWWEKLIMWSRRNRNVAIWAATSAILLIAIGVGASIAAWNFKEANNRILVEKQKATSAQQRAVQDRTAAVNALTNLVDSLYNDLSENAATIEAREKLVDAAISGLQSVSTVDDDDIAADRTAFLASLRVADLSALKGDNETAAENYERAIELARTLVELRPDDDMQKLDLALAISQMGVLNRDNNADLSLKLSSESEAILTKVLANNPDNFKALTKLVHEKGNRLELIRNKNVTDHETIIEYANTILPDLDRLLEQEDQVDTHVLQAAYLIHFLLGRTILESGDGETANQYFESARRHIASALKHSPNNSKLKAASASLDRASFMTAGYLAQMGKSLTLFESALAKYKQLSAANPDDLNLRSQVANTLSLGSLTLLYNGKMEESIHASNDAEKFYEDLIETAPDNALYGLLLVEIRMRSIYVFLSAGEWQQGFEQGTETLELLNELIEERPDDMKLVNFKSQLIVNLQTASWLVGQPPQPSTPLAKVYALCFAFRPSLHEATSFDLPAQFLEKVQGIVPEFEGTTFDDALALVKEVSKDIPAMRTQCLGLDLAIHGMIARNCAALPDEKMQDRSAQCIDRCINLLKADPLDKMTVMGNPDLKWFFNTDEFQAILPELQAAWKK